MTLGTTTMVTPLSLPTNYLHHDNEKEKVPPHYQHNSTPSQHPPWFMGREEGRGMMPRYSVTVTILTSWVSWYEWSPRRMFHVLLFLLFYLHSFSVLYILLSSRFSVLCVTILPTLILFFHFPVCLSLLPSFHSIPCLFHLNSIFVSSVVYLLPYSPVLLLTFLLLHRSPPPSFPLLIRLSSWS